MQPQVLQVHMLCGKVQVVTAKGQRCRAHFARSNLAHRQA